MAPCTHTDCLRVCLSHRDQLVSPTIGVQCNAMSTPGLPNGPHPIAHLIHQAYLSFQVTMSMSILRFHCIQTSMIDIFMIKDIRKCEARLQAPFSIHQSSTHGINCAPDTHRLSSAPLTPIRIPEMWGNFDLVLVALGCLALR